MPQNARRYGGLSAEQRYEARRSRLIEATIVVLAQGEDQATMTKICAQAGLTERYFYESFSSREEALLAALDAVSGEIAAATVAAITQTDGPPQQRARAALSALVTLLEKDRHRGLVAVVESNSTAALRNKRRELMATFAQLVATEAHRLYGDEVWPQERAEIHGLVLAAGIAELMGAWLTGAVTLTHDQLVDAATDLFAAVTRRPDPRTTVGA
jgi:AcrR family transcriptional regulator